MFSPFTWVLFASGIIYFCLAAIMLTTISPINTITNLTFFPWKMSVLKNSIKYGSVFCFPLKSQWFFSYVGVIVNTQYYLVFTSALPMSFFNKYMLTPIMCCGIVTKSRHRSYCFEFTLESKDRNQIII